MKRPILLVSYDSSDDGEDTGRSISGGSELATTSAEISMAKRKLPKLSQSLTVATPEANPLLHQGRIRTMPHADGQFAAYVFVPVVLDQHSTELHQLLADALNCAKDTEPALQSDWYTHDLPNAQKANIGTRELHISLTRPIYLRAHQREELKRAVKQAAQNHPTFVASFAAFATFVNDERTRAFVGMEVGAGHAELQSLSETLKPLLRLLHQRPFYEDPRFHASFAWALLDRQSPAPKEATPIKTCLPGNNSTGNIQQPPQFPTITSLSPDLLTRLAGRFGRTLATKAGIFEVSEIRVKIGKEIYDWPLAK
ncbi:hypothetical protein BD410DRAFT_787528 [Rickenella mellea]|uniref:U6 snRNA phosphodiesterase 1 n=1 Tax=Rickenella mellea TaxID=50990 RepID=A0A4Y7Q7B2_9AGAM|nr:hypothetical protein BD410DRAFT_787528 [Rickenella mellea]